MQYSFVMSNILTNAALADLHILYGLVVLFKNIVVLAKYTMFVNPEVL